MPSKVQAYAQMADHAATQITGSRQSWTDFLSTAARLYKYPYNEQLMIYAQRPDATACADYDLWNNQMRRYVRRGSKGIALIDATGDKPRLRYVFDISDTGGGENSRRPFLWELNAEHEAPVTAMLERNYDISGNEGLAEQLQHVAAQMADEYWMDNQRDILYNIDDSFLEGYDDFNVGVAFREAATVSISYMLMKRCGIDPEDYFEHEDYFSVFDFNTPSTVAALGTATSEISQLVLRQIEVTIKNYECERSKDDERNDIQPERGLSDTRPDVDRAEPADRQIREDAEELPERTSPGVIQFPAAAREAVSAPVGDRADRAEPPYADDEGAAGGTGRDREPESQRSDEVGGPDEQLQSTGRGNDTRGADLQLSAQPVQLSLFPSEAEQIAQIAEAESVKPSAFSMPAKPPNPMWGDYEAVKLQHSDDILLYQMGDFFEMYGEDAELAAKVLDLSLTSRAISGEGRIPMCGIPAHRLEQYVEQLRDKYDVTISGIEEQSGVRRVYSLPSIDHEAERAIDEYEAEHGADGWRAFPGNAPDQQEAAAPMPPRAIMQADIDAAIQSWNGNIESKQRVERYMLDHSRDKETAAWLSREYGGTETKSLFITITGTDLETELSWPKVQRHLAKLVKEDRFFTEAEQVEATTQDEASPLLAQAKELIDGFCQREYGSTDNYDDLTKIGVAYTTITDDEIPIQVNINLVDFRLERYLDDTLIDVRQYASLQEFIDNELNSLDFSDLISVTDEEIAMSKYPTPQFAFAIGDTVYLEDGKPFIVESVTDMHIQLRDPSLYYPILRAESWESFSRLMERYPQPERPLPEAKEAPEITPRLLQW